MRSGRTWIILGYIYGKNEGYSVSLSVFLIYSFANLLSTSQDQELDYGDASNVAELGC